MFTLSSPAFKDGGTIPENDVEDRFTSPPLKWDNAPDGTECFFLLMADQDIPDQFREKLGRGFVHWMACIPGSVSELAEDASPGTMPFGSLEFKNETFLLTNRGCFVNLGRKKG